MAQAKQRVKKQLKSLDLRMVLMGLKALELFIVYAKSTEAERTEALAMAKRVMDFVNHGGPSGKPATRKEVSAFIAEIQKERAAKAKESDA
jgi:hypothetical protein